MTNATVEKCCGSCKWLVLDYYRDSPLTLTKSGRTHKRHDYSSVPCVVPFDVPAFPARFRVEIYDKKFTCPSYGTDCAFYERRVVDSSGSNGKRELAQQSTKASEHVISNG